MDTNCIKQTVESLTKVLLVYTGTYELKNETNLFLLNVNQEQLRLLKKHTGKVVYVHNVTLDEMKEIKQLIHDLDIYAQPIVNSVDVKKTAIKFVFHLGWED